MFQKLRLWLSAVPYRRRLLLSYIGLTCLTLALAFGTLTALLSNILMQSESRHLRQLVAVVNADLNSRITDINSRGFDIVIDTSIRDSLNQTDDIDVARARTKVESILKLKLISSNYLRNIMIVDTSLHQFSTNVALLLPPDFALQRSQVYRDAAQKNGSLVWLSENDLYDLYTLDNMYKPDTDIHAAAVIMDYSHGTQLGLMVLSLNRNYFLDITYPAELLSDSSLSLVSPDKKAIYGIAGNTGGMTAEDLERLDFEGGEQWISSNRLLVCQYNDAMGWYLVSTTRTTVLGQGMADIAVALLLVFAAFMILAAVFSQRLAKQGARGIVELIAAMEKVERDDFDVNLPVIRRDELGRITDAFNRMVRRLRDLIHREYQEKLLMQEARFKNLQSQIRPHFLMNTFDMLHWKLLERGQDELAETVVSLSHLMQYSTASGEWVVTLDQELQNVQEYLMVHNNIRGGDIRLEIDAASPEEISLPRQTLQPLVENAVLHGFAGRDHGNVLTIRGVETRDGYEICVEDNGLGIPAEELERLNALLQNPEQTADRHIGLLNVTSRLTYMHKGAEVLLESEYGRYTIVKLHIPNVRNVE